MEHMDLVTEMTSFRMMQVVPYNGLPRLTPAYPELTPCPHLTPSLPQLTPAYAKLTPCPHPYPGLPRLTPPYTYYPGLPWVTPSLPRALTLPAGPHSSCRPLYPPFPTRLLGPSEPSGSQVLPPCPALPARIRLPGGARSMNTLVSGLPNRRNELTCGELLQTSATLVVEPAVHVRHSNGSFMRFAQPCQQPHTTPPPPPPPGRLGVPREYPHLRRVVEQCGVAEQDETPTEWTTRCQIAGCTLPAFHEGDHKHACPALPVTATVPPAAVVPAAPAATTAATPATRGATAAAAATAAAIATARGATAAAPPAAAAAATTTAATAATPTSAASNTAPAADVDAATSDAAAAAVDPTEDPTEDPIEEYSQASNTDHGAPAARRRSSTQAPRGDNSIYGSLARLALGPHWTIPSHWISLGNKISLGAAASDAAAAAADPTEDPTEDPIEEYSQASNTDHTRLRAGHPSTATPQLRSRPEAYSGSIAHQPLPRASDVGDYGFDGFEPDTIDEDDLPSQGAPAARRRSSTQARLDNSICGSLARLALGPHWTIHGHWMLLGFDPSELSTGFAGVTKFGSRLRSLMDADPSIEDAPPVQQRAPGWVPMDRSSIRDDDTSMPGHNTTGSLMCCALSKRVQNMLRSDAVRLYSGSVLSEEHHPKERFASYPEIIACYNRSGGYCARCSNPFSAIIAERELDPHSGKSTAASLLRAGAVWSPQRKFNFLMHVASNISQSAICANCNRDTGHAEQLRIPFFEQGGEQSAVLTAESYEARYEQARAWVAARGEVGGPVSTLPAGFRLPPTSAERDTTTAFECKFPSCKKVMYNRDSARRHARNHGRNYVGYYDGNNPDRCWTARPLRPGEGSVCHCGRSFPNRSALSQHMTRSHSSDDRAESSHMHQRPRRGKASAASPTADTGAPSANTRRRRTGGTSQGAPKRQRSARAPAASLQTPTANQHIFVWFGDACDGDWHECQVVQVEACQHNLISYDGYHCHYQHEGKTLVHNFDPSVAGVPYCHWRGWTTASQLQQPPDSASEAESGDEVEDEVGS